MLYQSKRAALKELIEKFVIPGTKKKDLDYNLIVNELMKQAGVSKDIVEDVLNSFIKNGEMKEIRILTIPDEKFNNWLEDLIKDEKQTKEDLEVLECQNKKEQDSQ